MLGSVGLDTAPDALASGECLGISFSEWLAGHSFAMSAFIVYT